MPLMSMTGFARRDVLGPAVRATWELRSVNGKGLDVRLRLPPGFERLEVPVRERCAAKLARGNVQASLALQATAAAARFKINEEVLQGVLAAMERINTRFTVQPPTLDGILSIRGVVDHEEADVDQEARPPADARVIYGHDPPHDDLVAQRAREGAAIATVLNARLDAIERLTADAEASPARTPETIRARLAEQIATLLDAAPALDPDRLHQEAVLLATKADIREEIDRLHAHVAAARELLAGGGAVGRRLDFLAQEFNREVNTLCAKSNDRALTATGLEMKAVVDQLREQIQNVE